MTRVVVACAFALLGCKTRIEKVATPPHATTRELHVPIASGPIELDGEPEEHAWSNAVRTGPFLDEHSAPARPFTEVRFLRDAHTLYLHLYAADEDLRCPKVGADGPVWLCDRFRVVFHGADGDRVVTVTPRGELADGHVSKNGTREDRSWQSYARLGADTDGTLDDPRDDDEEWAVELAVPLASVALESGRTSITVERVDVGGKDRHHARLRYGATLILDGA